MIRNSFDSSFLSWPLMWFNKSIPFLAMLVFAMLMVGHLVSFMFNCVWFYEPSSIRSCNNHRPPIVREKQTVELKVVRRLDTGSAMAVTTAVPKQNNTTPSVQSAGKILVDANIRGGPGMGYPIIGTLQEGAEVEILATQEGWHRIRRVDQTLPDEPSQIGWVWKDLLEE